MLAHRGVAWTHARPSTQRDLSPFACPSTPPLTCQSPSFRGVSQCPVLISGFIALRHIRRFMSARCRTDNPFMPARHRTDNPQFLALDKYRHASHAAHQPAHSLTDALYKKCDCVSIYILDGRKKNR